MSIYNDYKVPSEGGMFLKFEDGKVNKLRLTSEPYIFTSEFTDKVTGETKISTKYAWGVWNYDERAAQVMQLPVTGFRQIQELAQDSDWGEPTEYDLKVTRTGTGLETKYSIVPNPNKTALPEDAVELTLKVDVGAAVKGIPLSRFVQGDVPPLPTKNEIREQKDIVITDFDEVERTNLDDIPFN